MIAIYARQSIEKENSISIDAQIASCKKIIDVSAETKDYIDKGYSGSNINRPEFEQLLLDIKNGMISAVYCYRLDRISRNILDFANLQEYFSKYNCSFISSSENLDTSSPMGRAMINIVMVFAQLERETIAGRIKDSYFARAKIGAYLGGGLPFGYTTIKKDFNGKQMSVLYPDKKTAPIVKEIYKEYTESRTSLVTIAKKLNGKNIKTSTGKPFTGNGIRRILMNPIYTTAMPEIYDYYFSQGYNIYNKIDDFNGKSGCQIVGKFIGKNTPTPITDHMLVISAHQPIVDSETFIEAQITLSKNKISKRSGTGKVTWLTGLIKCGECGYSVTTKKTTKRGKKYLYLVCRGHSNLGNSICTQTKHHTIKNLEKYVEKELLNHVSNLDVKKLRIDNNPSPNIKTKQQLIKVKQQIDNLIDALSELDASDARAPILKKINELYSVREDLSKKLMPKLNANNKKIISTVEQIKKQWESADLKTKNEWANVLIKSISITSDTIDIAWHN